MFVKSIVALAALATVVTLAGPARAALTGNALSNNALSNNALSNNALSNNALSNNALSNNALSDNGLRPAATAANAGPSAPAPSISGILLPSGERLIAR